MRRKQYDETSLSKKKQLHIGKKELLIILKYLNCCPFHFHFVCAISGFFCVFPGFHHSIVRLLCHRKWPWDHAFATATTGPSMTYDNPAFSCKCDMKKMNKRVQFAKCRYPKQKRSRTSFCKLWEGIYTPGYT